MAAPSKGVSSAERKELFVLEYMKDFNGTRAGKAIGLAEKSAHVEASKLLNDPKVQSLMMAAKERLMDRQQLSLDIVLDRFSNFASASMEHYTRLNSDGHRVIDLSECTPKQLAAIQEVTVDEYWEGSGDNAREVKRTKIKLYSAADANDKLLRYLGGYNGKEAPNQTNIYNDNRQQIAVTVTVEQAADEYQRMIGGK